MVTNGDVLRMKIRALEIEELLLIGKLPQDVLVSLKAEMLEYIRILNAEVVQDRRAKFKVIK